MSSTVDKGISEYRKQTVSTASPLQLVLMLYDAALGHCEAAKKAIEEGDLETQHARLSKAQRIVSELAASLDMEQGVEMAQNLFALYSYCLDELTEANIEDKTAPIERCIRVLTELREAWKTIFESAKEEGEDAA